MLSSALPGDLQLRAMVLEDVARVAAIEQRAKPSPWPAAAFENELSAVTQSIPYVLLRQEHIVGYGIVWLLVDELHVHTLVVDPPFQGRGWGELLLLYGLGLGVDGGAAGALLEVRRSNHSAQQLYTKLGFEQVGERPRYYRDTGEDALLMTLAPLTRSRLEPQWRKLKSRLSSEKISR